MEPIVLLGLIFVSAVVIYFMYQALTFTSSEVPVGVSEEQKAARMPIEDLVKTAAEEALRETEFQGGFSYQGLDNPK